MTLKQIIEEQIALGKSSPEELKEVFQQYFHAPKDAHKKICKNCKHFSPDDDEGFLKKRYPGRGSCSSGKLLDGPPEDTPYQSDTAYGGGYEGYGDYICVGENFGCIHFSKKKQTT